MRQLLTVLSISLSTSLTAFRLSLPESAPADLADQIQYDYTGIVALRGCSGSIVRFEDSLPQDKALIMTNGHCVKIMEPDSIFYRKSSRKEFTVLNSDAESIGILKATELTYATMTGTDLAIYEVSKTYDEIYEDFEVKPLTLSPYYVELGEEIEIISGYWRRGYTCQAESFIPVLKEADWTFKESILYSRPGCETIGGTSGSPVILKGTRTVIGVNNTGNESGAACTMNNPCEVGEDGEIFYEKGRSYAQQIAWLYSCRNYKGQIDLDVIGCKLFQP